MTTLLDHTDLEVGIAKTQGLKENIFMTVVCTFAASRSPCVRAVEHIHLTCLAKD